MTKKTHLVFVYGTLRKMLAGLGVGDAPPPATHQLWGFDMYDYGGYPYIIEDTEAEIDAELYVYGNVYEVDDDTLAELDHYEGVARGLFVRQTVTVELLGTASGFADVWAYVAGPALTPKRIPSGDWFDKETDDESH